jgi:hypothetical protein
MPMSVRPLCKSLVTMPKTVRLSDFADSPHRLWATQPPA